jgi:hypothetical protein
MRTLARAAAAVGLLVAGAGTALASVAVHEISWGLWLAAAATLLTLVALPPGWWARLPFALGFAAFVGWMVGPRADGGYAVSSDARGYALVGLALLVLVLGIATLPRPAPRTRPTPAREAGSAPTPSLDSAP